MNNVLPRNTDTDDGSNGTDDGGRLARLLGGGSGSDATGDRDASAFLVVDLGGVFDRLRSGRGTSSTLGEVVGALPVEREQLPAIETGAIEPDSGSRRRGRGAFRALLALGAVLGIGYLLRGRTGSADETVEDVAEETETVAERAASVIQRRGEVAATRIEEGSEAVAERIESGGEEAADRITEAGETAAEAEAQAEDAVEGTANADTDQESDGSDDE